MSSKSNLFYTVLFSIIYIVYWLTSKIQKFVERTVRTINISANSINKIQEKLNLLNKFPEQVILTIQINDKVNNDRKIKNLIGHLLYYVQIIRKANVKQIKICFNGVNANINPLKSALQQIQYKDALSNIQIIDFEKFHSNLTLQSMEWNKKSVPLLISMCSYESINCVPFSYLIDAQFVFCPPITQCLTIDIQRCFQQYASSKQRHGK